MQATFPRLCLSIVALSAVAVLAHAGPMPPAPPIKAGLWEVANVRLDENGKPRDDMQKMQQSMQNMPPEMRARMAEMMKARGVDMSGGNGAMKVCVSKESFEQGKWQQMAAAAGCKTDYASTSGNTWKWHSSCPTMKSESDGETVFTSPESYSTKMVTTSNIMGKASTTSMTSTAKWLGANCGDLKPMTADPVK